MPKKYLPIIIVLIVLIVVGGGIFAFTKLRGKPASETAQETKKKRSNEPVNTIAQEQRPYVQLKAESSGKNVELSVIQLNKPATSVEYELEYQSGSLLQGAFGELELGTLPTNKTILLGSCSAGGACTYHKEVKGGSLLLRFTGPENYGLKTDWKYIENTTKEKAHSSRDAKFQISGDMLAKVPYMIIYNTPGVPQGLSSTLLSNAYTLSASTDLQSNSGLLSLTLRLNEEGAATIMGWDGKAWKEFTTTVNGKEATAQVQAMEVYVAVKK